MSVGGTALPRTGLYGKSSRGSASGVKARGLLSRTIGSSCQIPANPISAPMKAAVWAPSCTARQTKIAMARREAAASTAITTQAQAGRPA